MIRSSQEGSSHLPDKGAGKSPQQQHEAGSTDVGDPEEVVVEFAQLLLATEECHAAGLRMGLRVGHTEDVHRHQYLSRRYIRHPVL